jgi:hypothetical protein
MKKILFTIVLVFLFGLGYSQTKEERVTISKSELTIDQLKKLEEDELLKKLDHYGKWVGIGGEIGTAVRESLMGVVDVADKFGDTNVGKFTLVMVAWKIIGKDLIRIFLGVIFLIMFTIMFWRNYSSKFMYQKIRKTGHWYKFWEPYEFELHKPEKYEGFEFMRLLYMCMYIGAFGITYLIMFG